MLSNVELQTTILDRGIPGVSPLGMLLTFAMMLLISMVPYFLLYVSLRPKRPAAGPSTNFLNKIAGWLHYHRHPELLHH